MFYSELEEAIDLIKDKHIIYRIYDNRFQIRIGYVVTYYPIEKYFAYFIYFEDQNNYKLFEQYLKEFLHLN